MTSWAVLALNEMMIGLLMPVQPRPVQAATMTAELSTGGLAALTAVMWIELTVRHPDACRLCMCLCMWLAADGCGWRLTI